MPYRSAHLPMMICRVPGGLAPWSKEQVKRGPENSSRRLPGPCETIGPRPTRTAIPDSSGRCPAGWTTGPSGCHARNRTAILGVKVRCPAVGRHGMVAGGGIEPPTSGFRDRRSATELTRSVGGPTGLEPAYLEPQSSALPLSYSPHENWSDRPDLNRRPLPPQGSALPD